ncbi:hypothetical protein [uncultured Lacinutrix sp.]|uniref:hypothetical protein n=1 Tax=uncultured Lacinutrix sp. TaxID=574032 RepID=UPI00261706D2|nr:hypothetical protein [uncultured Lacinutrix sp.]
MKKLNEKQLIVARQEYKPYLSLGEKKLSKLKLNTEMNFFSQKLNTTFESLGCVGYNSAKQQLTATINIKRETGYLGGLCTNGSYEYVRFYMDYQDGNGWEDMGVVGVNVHDIPTEKDCVQKDEKPITYVARLDISSKRKYCSVPNLPIVRAVLSWNSIPEPNDPDLALGTYVWSDTKDAQIQIEPYKFFIPDFTVFEIDDILNTAILNPNLSLNQLTLGQPEKKLELDKVKTTITPKALNFNELSLLYNNEKIEPHRFGYKELQKVINTPYSSDIASISNLFELNNWSLAESLEQLYNIECNNEYEELVCVGADYNREALVGTFKVKKSSGYSGDLCSDGSKEYVSFWVQTEENCEWVHAGTTSVNVYDIPDVPDDGLFYSAVLPYKFNGLKKDCQQPQVLKVKAVLSWNVAPEDMGCPRWGDILESYVQLQPEEVSIGVGPEMKAIGGIHVDYINNMGFSMLNAHFRYSGLPVTLDSAFAGVVVVEAETNKFDGQSYKIRVDNLDTGESYYEDTAFRKDDIFDWSYADPVTKEYTYYGDATNNSLNIVARFRPRYANNRIRVTIEHSDLTSYSKVIQMDNISPKLTLNIDNYGDCSHFVKGSIITGNYEVEETYLDAFTLSTTVADPANLIVASGVASNAGNFSIVTSSSKNCGDIVLSARPRTVVNSVSMHSSVPKRRIICLKDPS